jgi:hypothetical protein
MRRFFLASALLGLACGGSPPPGGGAQAPVAAVIGPPVAAVVESPLPKEAWKPSNVLLIARVKNAETMLEDITRLTKSEVPSTALVSVINLALSASLRDLDLSKPMTIMFFDAGPKAGGLRNLYVFTPRASAAVPSNRAQGHTVHDDDEEGGSEFKCSANAFGGLQTLCGRAADLAGDEAKYLVELARKGTSFDGIDVQVMPEFLKAKLQSERSDDDDDDAALEQQATALGVGLLGDVSELHVALSTQSSLTLDARAVLPKLTDPVARVMVSVSPDTNAGARLAAFPADTLAGFTSAGGTPEDYALLRKRLLSLFSSKNRSAGARLAADILDDSAARGGGFSFGWALDRAEVARILALKSPTAADDERLHKAQFGTWMFALEDAEHRAFDGAKRIRTLLELAQRDKDTSFAVGPKAAALGKLDHYHFVLDSPKGPHVYVAHDRGKTFVTVARTESTAVARLKSLVSPAAQTLGAKIPAVIAAAAPPHRSAGFFLPALAPLVIRAKERSSVAVRGPSQLGETPVVGYDEVQDVNGARVMHWNLTMTETNISDAMSIASEMLGSNVFNPAGTGTRKKTP